MSGGGGFRGRGYGPHGHRHQGPRPDLSGGSGSRGGSGGRYSGSRQDGPGQRSSGPNSRPDGPNSRLGGPNFNPRGGGPPRGPCPNFNPSRHPPRLPNRPNDNWSPRGGSPQFQSWRGARPQRFNAPSRPFYRGRGQGQYMPRFPFVPTGNFAPPYMPYQPFQEPKPVEHKPAVPHLGSEEERQQKITEAADALKRKLSAVAKEPDEWRDDDDDEGLVEPSQDADHDSRIANKGIPELKHDPPELNLTLNDLRDIGRVDHEYRTEQSKSNTEIDQNYEFDESEVKILAHNPVKPMIEIDLYGDDNYGEYAGDESGDRTTEEMGMSSNMQDTSQNHDNDSFSATCGFQSFNDSCTFSAPEDYGQEPQSKENVDEATQQEITMMENVIDQQNEAVSECNTKEVNTELQMDANRSDRYDKVQGETANDSSVDKTDAELIVAAIVPQDEISTTNGAGSEEFQSEATFEASEQRDPENQYGERATVPDNLDNLDVTQKITNSPSQGTEGENNMERLCENWVELRNTSQCDNTRIPGLDSLYPNEITAQPSEGSKSCSNVESAIIESETEQNSISDARSEVEPAIIKKEIKESRKEVKIENLDKTLNEGSDVSIKFDRRVRNESDIEKDNTSRETRREKSKDTRDEKKDRALSGFSDKLSDEAKPDEDSSRHDKKTDERNADKQQPSLKSKNQKNLDRKRLVRKMTETSVASSNRSRGAPVSKVPPNFDPREPPPMSFDKSLFSIPPPSMPQASQDSSDSPIIPPAFDPRLSVSDRNALLPPAPSISSAISVAQDFAYPPRTITSFPPIVPAINYGPTPMILPTNVEPTANIPPMCLGDPYAALLPLPNVPVSTPISMPVDNSLLLPPLPIEPPPPPPSTGKSNIDMDDGLEDMQEAMEFAKQLMNMDDSTEMAEEINSIDSDFFHMPTFPDLPPIELPAFLPADIPTPPEVKNVSINRETKINKESKRSKSSKQETDIYGPQPMPEELRKNENSVNEIGDEKMDIADEERPKVMFNLSSKNKVISKDNEWIQQQHREDAAEAAASAAIRYPPLAPATTETIRLPNGQDDRKKLQNDIKIEKTEPNSSKSTSNNSQNKKPAELPSHSRSRSQSPAKSKQTKLPKSANTTDSEVLPRKITKESTARKSTEETPESSWKSRVIGRFLKMSKNDIGNMLNNTGRRTFDIAMKHLVKERTSSLSFNMRKKEEEKLKDPEASYNREEFMDQLSAMLDPSATVDVCNLPTEFLHHLSEVLQLESMSDLGEPFTPLENVEVPAASPTQQVAQQATRLSRENANAKEIDDRRSSKRGREKKSTNTGCAVETSVATPSAPTTEVRKTLRPAEDSIVPKCAVKKENIVEEVQKTSTMALTRTRRRLHRSGITDHPETSTTAINGSASRENPNSLNMAVLDDLFTEGIAKAKKKTIHPSKNDKNTGSSENEVHSGCSNQAEKYDALAKDPSVDRVQRAAVELDKIFTAGIAKAKLASRKVAAAAARAAEANDGDDDEDDAGWRYNDDRSHSHNTRGRHRSFSRHIGRCEKWNRRKAREVPDTFRNLTKEEWEAKYGETSDSTYEREYRAMVAMNARKTAHSPTYYRDDHEAFGEENMGGGGNVMSRLGNIVAGGSGLNEPWVESDEDRRLRNSIDNADYTIESYNNSSEDNSSSSSASDTSSETSQTESPEVPSVTKLLKVIKAREKIGKKRSLNEEIRDEVNADIERKRRERGKVSRKGHKSRTKKSHRRKKDKKVKEKKKRLRKRKKRKSRRSGSDDENSGDEYSDEEGTSSLSQSQLLTQEEIKKELDVIIVIKDEPDSEVVQPAVEKKQTKSAVPVKAVEDSRSSIISSTPSIPTGVGASPATISPSQMKTKAQLKQLPPDLLNKTVATAEISKETPKKQVMPIKVVSKETASKLVGSSISAASPVVSEPSSSPHSINTSSSVQKNSTTNVSTENLLSKTHSKKLDFNTYKERTRLRMLRENEKIRLINENPSSLTQNLLNIPLTRKKVAEKNETVVQIAEQHKDPRLATNVQLPSTTISDFALCPTTSKIATSTMASKGSTINTATTTVITTKTSTIAKTSETSTTNAKTSDISTSNVNPSATSTANARTLDVNATKVKPSATITTTDKTTAIKTTTAKPSALSTTTAKSTTIATTTDKTSLINTTASDETLSINTTTSDKTLSINTTMSDKTSSINTTTMNKTSSINTTTSDKILSIDTTTSDKTSSINTTIPIIPSIVDPVNVPTSESTTVQQLSSTKAPVKKLIRRRSVTKTPTSESTLIQEARAEAGKFAHIKSEGSKEMKLREKLKKGRQRVSSEGLATTIPLIQQPRLKKRPSSLVRNAEEPTSLPVKQKIDEVPVKRKFNYFKKGPVSDLLPDTVPQEFLPVFKKISTKIDDVLEQSEIDPLAMPIADLSTWPLDSCISTNIADEIDTNSSPPFKGFPDEPILRRDRVLTEAELNSEIDALEAVPLAFEDGADALPMSTVVDLNDLRSTGLPMDEPISYGDEEFVEGRVEIETTLLGFSVTNDIPDDPEAVAALGDDEFVPKNVEQSLEKFPEESHESIDILPRVTSTLSDSPAPVDFLIAEVQRPESIPSPLLVTESVRENNEESIVTDFSNNHIEEKKKAVDTSCDDVAEVTSSHESHTNATSDAYLETIGPDSETSSSRVTSNAEDKDISFRPEIANDKAENASEAQEMQEKRTFHEDTSTKDVPSTNSTLEMIHTPPPQPSSSSDSTEEKNKELAMENHRDASETRDSETKTKESSHHSHSKSRDHLDGKSKRKSGRHHNHESKSKKKVAITEKIVKEAVVANIVKLVPKPTNKETVMARMIEIDVEIHKLMNEKMTLYKMLESGEFPVKEDGAEISSAKTNSEPKVTNEIDETVPPTVLASRLVRDLDKTVIPTPATVQDNSRKSDGRKGEAEDEGKKSRQKRSPHREAKNRTKDNATAESRRQRKISESKSHSRRTTSEESSRHDTTSTHSREKSTSSTELEDAEEKNLKRKSKSLPRRSPHRRSSKRSREYSSKEDLGEGSRESTDRSAKSTKEDTRNSLEENTLSKSKKKTKNLEAKKSEEKGKVQKEEKKLSADSKVTEKNEIANKKSIGDGERGVIYSDESTWDSLEPEAIQGDEHRGKKDSGPTTGLALLEESFKREIAETRKLKTVEKRKGKKQELRRILLESSALTTDEEHSLRKESLTLGKGKDKDTGKVMKHMTTVIDAVAENRVEQLYNDETSSEPRDTFSDSSSIKDTAAEEKEEDNVPEMVEEATKTTVADKDEHEKPDDSEAVVEPVEEEKTVVEETTEVSDAKKSSDNEDPQENLEHNISNEENTKKPSEIDALVEESTKKVEHENSTEENNHEQDSSIKTSSDVPAGKEEDKEDQIEENQSSTNLHKSESVADQEKEVNDKTTKKSPSSSPDMTDTASKITAEVEGNRKTQAQPKNQISEKESLKGSRDSLDKAPESSKEKRNAKDTETERVRSKSRIGRSRKQRNVVLRDASPKEKKSHHTDKHNSSKAEDNKDDTEKSSTRPRSATKRKQREKSTPPNRRSSRYPEDGGKRSRSKKREKSSSRGLSPYEGEPARKKPNHSRRSSSPLVQVPRNEDRNRRRGRKRKRRPEITREEMASCKVLLIDCKYTYLSPSMHPRILKKLGIAKINPYTAPTVVPEAPASPKMSKDDTHSTPDFSKVELSEEPEESPKESRSSLTELESAKERSSSPSDRPSSPKERPSSPSDRPSSPKDRSSSPKERSSSPKERSSSPKERSSSPKERPSSSLPKERSSSPKERPSSPLPEERLSPPPLEESPSSPIEPPVHRCSKPIPSSPDRNPSSPQIKPPSPTEISNRVEVDEDDDEDDVFDETIQIIKAADENLPLTSQSEDDEVEGVMDVIEETEDVPDVADEAVDVAEEDPDVAEEEAVVAEEDAVFAEEEAVDAEEEAVDAEEEAVDAEEEADVAEEEVHVAEEQVMDVAEEVADVTDVAEEPAAPPDSTADDITVADDSVDNSNNENIQEADTTDEVQVLEENITIVDKPAEIHELAESEAEDEDVEPRRTRYTVHKGPILDIKVLDDSFLAASEDGAIYRYSQQSNGILNIYKGHEAAVTCIYVLRTTGKCWKLYSGSLDGSFRCYDITTGLQERPPAAVGSPVQCMDQAWGVFFVGTKSGHISRYNIKSGSIKGDRLEFSDKSVLALKASSEGPRRILIVASRNQPITIRDALTGLFLRTICGYKNHTVYSLMRERNLVYCGTSSTSIPVFDFTNGEQITQYNAGVGIVCMRLYRQILFAGCYDGNIYVFDTKETKLVCSIPGPGNMLLSMEIVGDEIIAGSKDRQLHSWRMPRQVRILLAERT